MMEDELKPEDELDAALIEDDDLDVDLPVGEKKPKDLIDPLEETESLNDLEEEELEEPEDSFDDENPI